jgi:hypothetical protein
MPVVMRIRGPSTVADPMVRLPFTRARISRMARSGGMCTAFESVAVVGVSNSGRTQTGKRHWLRTGL